MNDGIQTLDTSDSAAESFTYTPYEIMNFESAVLVSPAHLDPETNEVIMPVYSCNTPINPQTLKHIQDGIKNLEQLVLQILNK